MAKRILAAGFVVMLAGVVAVAPEAFAAGRGPTGGRGSAPHGLQAPVGKTVVHARAHLGMRDAARLNHRRALTPLWNGWWNTCWYGGCTEPSSTTIVNDRAALTEPGASYGPTYYSGGPYPLPYTLPTPKPLDVIVYRPGCSTQAETVPWSDGKERTIAMVRC
jgi:hypothetical protein